MNVYYSTSQLDFDDPNSFQLERWEDGKCIVERTGLTSYESGAEADNANWAESNM